MIDLKWIIENPEAFDKAMERRNCEVRAKTIIELNEKRKADITELQDLQAERNSISKERAIPSLKYWFFFLSSSIALKSAIPW